MKKSALVRLLACTAGILLLMPYFSVLPAGAEETYTAPTGTSDKDRLYILLYDHSDTHGERFSVPYLWEHYILNDQEMVNTYPSLRLGNQYGGAFYDVLNRPENASYAEEYKSFVQNDRVGVIGGTYSQAISGLLPEESAIRQFTYGMPSIEAFTGKKVQIYGHSENTAWAYLPQILKDFGFSGALLRTHWAPLGQTPSVDAALVNWTGPDGSKILTVPTYTGDNMKANFSGMNRGEAEFVDWMKYIPGTVTMPVRLEALDRYYAQKKEQGIDYVVMTVIEDTLFKDHIQALMPDLLKADPKGEKYKFVTAEELFSILPASEAVDFAPKAADFSQAMNVGFYGDNLTRRNGQVSALLSSTEAVVAFRRLSGDTAAEDYRGKLEEAYKLHLNAEAHDAYAVPETTGVALDQLASAEALVKPIQEETLKELLKQIKNPHEGPSLAVFNTQGYDRREPVSMMITLGGDERVTAVTDGNGKAVPYEITSVQGTTSQTTAVLCFVADMPAYSHQLYTLQTETGKQTVTLRDISSQGNTVMGNGYTLVLNGQGEIQELATDGGAKIISSVGADGGLYYTGNFYDLDSISNGSMYRSSGKVSRIWEGDVSTRIVTEGTIENQTYYTLFTVYKALPYIDVKTIFDFKPNAGIGTLLEAQHQAWGELDSNLRQKRLTVNFKPDFQLGENAADTLNAGYSLYDAAKYNEAVNISRYTPFYPEQYERRSEWVTLNTQGDKMFNHVYDILSRYYLDVSSKDGGRGLTLMTKGTGGYAYDGNTLSYVLGQSSETNKIVAAGLNVNYRLAGEKYSGNCYWDFRLVPHGQKTGSTDLRLTDGGEGDALRMALSYNNPLLVTAGEKTAGTLPAVYQYLEAEPADNLLLSSLSFQKGEVYLRGFEYKGENAAQPRLSTGGTAHGLTALSMDYQRPADSGEITPYKILTWKVELGKPAVKPPIGSGSEEKPGGFPFLIPLAVAGGVLAAGAVAAVIVWKTRKKGARKKVT